MDVRSLLFVPGNRSERFAKALAAGADAVCIDLEDAVPPEQKAAARSAVAAFLREGRGDAPAVGVRLNAPSTLAMAEDLAALAEALAHAAFIMAPKTQAGIELENLRAALGTGAPPLWPVIETARALEAAYEIAHAAGPDGGVLFGAADFSADVGCTLEWEALAYARGRLAAACAAAAIALLDVPHLNVKDEAGLIESTRRAKALGFTGRACIHPDQVAPVNACFTPTEAEIARAKRIIAALADAKGAAALLDGKLIEKPVILAAQRILDRAGAA
jgi:citrate lyase subunit beta/citryl-CoA lyase/(S)-citramalyl-CoA lyase